MSNIFKGVVYFLLSLVSGGKGVQRRINHFKIRFPARWSRYYQPDYEADNYSFLKAQAKPGMHIIDIGAHLGLFSTVSSELVGSTGKIICFEPTPGTYSVLLQTLKLNNCDNVIPVRGAVGCKEGAAIFYVSKTPGCNSNSLVKNKPGEDGNRIEVKLFTIDGIVREFSLQPGLIKIDAEGSELDALLGGTHTIHQFKPNLILGLHPAFMNQKGDSLETIWDLLQQSGYQVKQAGKNLTKSDFCSHTLVFDVQCI